MTKKYFIKSNDVLLLVCFTRSYDETHIKNKRIHLISSVASSSYDIDMSNIDFEFLREKIEKGMYRSTYYVFNVVDELNNKDEIPLINRFDNIMNNKAIVNFYDCVRVINIGFSALLTLLENGENLNITNDFIKEIFGDIDLKKKDFDSICQDSIFIFRNIS
jgi:hypothetical protein